ncbi:MAG: hypothetical protein ACK5YU_12490 [Burkholderiales bacterium]
MQNHYETLNLPENASEAWIMRQYQKLVEVAEQDSALDETERSAMISRLTNAKIALTDVMSRQSHDDELALWRGKRQRSGSLKGIALPGALATIVALVGGLWWQQIEKTRVLQAQIQLERAAEAKRVEEAAQEAKRRQDLLVAEAEARRVEEEERLRVAQEQRAAELKTEQYVPGKAFVPTLKTQAEIREERQQRYQESQRRMASEFEEGMRRAETERNSAAALAEIARQNRYLEQQRIEEERAAARRARAAAEAERRERVK